MNLVLLLLLAAPAGAAPPSPVPVATVAQATPATYGEAAPGRFADPMSSLIAAAASEGHSPERRAARDAIFRQVYPRLMAQGVAPSPSDADGIARATLSLACTAGTPRVRQALVMGDLAFVAASGAGGAASGGCTYLLRRDGSGWTELMPLSWTLRP